ncbi:MAG: hypothetical protein AB8B49_01010 [Nitratireductor sp.]
MRQKHLSLSVAKLSIIGLLASHAINPTYAYANNHFNMQWSFYQYNDALNNGRHTSRIDVGVPETDNKVATGFCSAGSSGSFSTFKVLAHIGNRVSGSNLGVEFFTPQGPIFMDGSVVEADFEEGFSGVALTIDNINPIWNYLADLSFISYRVAGNDYELSLRGSGNALRQYLNACNFYANSFVNNPNQPNQPNQPRPPQIPQNQPQPQPQPIPQPQPQPVPLPEAERMDPRWATCDTYANNVSQSATTSVSVTFTNNSDGHRSVMWIGYDGVPKQFADLDPGQSYRIKTYPEHPWMFTDGPGNCIEMFIAKEGVTSFEISAPGRDFGPE